MFDSGREQACLTVIVTLVLLIKGHYGAVTSLFFLNTQNTALSFQFHNDPKQESWPETGLKVTTSGS